jgi:hypothetical protein
MLQKFKLETLAVMDQGRIRAGFDQALHRAIADCKDRPALDKGRKVTLQCTVEPVVGEDGELESCDVTFSIDEKFPKRESKTYNMREVSGELKFNELSPEDVRQATIDDVPAPKKARSS